MNARKSRSIRKAAREICTSDDPLVHRYGRTAAHPYGHFRRVLKSLKRAARSH